MPSRVVTWSQELLDLLPPDAYSAVCADGGFGCGHWVHAAAAPDGNVVLAPFFAEFLRAKTAEVN